MRMVKRSQRRCAMTDREIDVVLSGIIEIFKLEVRERSRWLGRSAEIHEATLQDLPRRHYRAGSQHEPGAQDSPIEHPSTDADETMAVDLATVERCLMPDRDALMDNGWRPSRQESTIVRNMDHGPVLDVTACADVDSMDVAAQDRSRPD